MTCGLEHQDGIAFWQGILEALDHNKTMASSVGITILMALDFNGIIYDRIRSLMTKDCGAKENSRKLERLLSPPVTQRTKKLRDPEPNRS